MNNELREKYWSPRNLYHFFQVRLQPSGNINNHLRKNNEGTQCLIQNHKYCISLQGHIGKYCICIIPLLYDAGCWWLLIWTTWKQFTVYWLVNIYIFIHWHIGTLASTTSEDWRCVLESSLWLPGDLKFITSLHRKVLNLQYKYGKRTTVK